MRRLFSLLLAVTVIICTFSPIGHTGDNDRIWVIAPETIRVIPNAEQWTIGLSVLALQSIPELSIAGLNIAGHEHGPPEIRPVPAAVVRGVSAATVDRWFQLRSGQGRLSIPEQVEFQQLNGRMAAGVDPGARPFELTIDPSTLPFTPQNGQDYPVTFTVGHNGRERDIAVIMAVRTLPTDSGWSPADLHIHTTYSDGHKTPSQLASILTDGGYRIVYVTDHSDGIANSGWPTYSSGVSGASTSNIKLYPGAEVTTGYRNWLGFHHQGDALAYGVNSLTGLENKTHRPQTAIDNIINNYPYGPSSAGVAHPTSLTYPWKDWTVLRYRGLELMCGVQSYFDDQAGPMVRWRSELSRTLSNTFNYGYFPSARTGSDWHATIFDPSHHDYVTWVRTGSWGTKSAVDTAVHRGRTVASRKGGLAYMTIGDGTTTRYVGDVWKGVPTGTTLRLRVTFKPTQSGTYTIRVWRNNKAELVFSHSGSYTAGYSYTPASNFQFNFPGGSNYYHLYVSGPDYIYSSPIFIRN